MRGLGLWVDAVTFLGWEDPPEQYACAKCDTELRCDESGPCPTCGHDSADDWAPDDDDDYDWTPE